MKTVSIRLIPLLLVFPMLLSGCELFFGPFYPVLEEQTYTVVEIDDDTVSYEIIVDEPYINVEIFYDFDITELNITIRDEYDNWEASSSTYYGVNPDSRYVSYGPADPGTYRIDIHMFRGEFGDEFSIWWDDTDTKSVHYVPET